MDGGTLAAVGVGGVISIASTWLAARLNIGGQISLQDKRFARDDRATRSIVQGLMLDAYQHVEVTARNADFEPEKWERAISRLLDYVTKIEVGHALSTEQVNAVLGAAFSAERALAALKNEIDGRVLPFSEDYEKRFPDVDLDHAEEFYVLRMRILSKTAYDSFNYALESLGLGERVDRSNVPSVEDVRDDFRSQIGRMPVERNAEIEDR